LIGQQHHLLNVAYLDNKAAFDSVNSMESTAEQSSPRHTSGTYWGTAWKHRCTSSQW